MASMATTSRSRFVGINLPRGAISRSSQCRAQPRLVATNPEHAAHGGAALRPRSPLQPFGRQLRRSAGGGIPEFMLILVCAALQCLTQIKKCLMIAKQGSAWRTVAVDCELTEGGNAMLTDCAMHSWSIPKRAKYWPANGADHPQQGDGMVSPCGCKQRPEG
jgi:hypothetical protein